MKDRTREAVFNLLGPIDATTHVWDLFAGTGAMGLEAISRGAARATLFEHHIPTAKLIEQNVALLELQDRVQVVRADIFHVHRQEGRQVGESPDVDRGAPWLVFCCPPYALYHEQLDAIRELLERMRDSAPASSVMVVEAEKPFDFTCLWPGDWQVRDYPPASIGIFRVPGVGPHEG
jgi:16S rRNA (guanine966-N2)-methyltransferase